MGRNSTYDPYVWKDFIIISAFLSIFHKNFCETAY